MSSYIGDRILDFWRMAGSVSYIHQQVSENRKSDPGGGCSRKSKVQMKLNKVTHDFIFIFVIFQ